MSSCVTASAPGSILLMGEHAVVYGHSAIVCAIDQRVTVRLLERSDTLMRIETSIAPPFEGPQDALPTDGPLKFVAAVLKDMRTGHSGGLSISITSDIDPTLGLGSSAAVTIALMGALRQFDALDLTPQDLHQRALRVVRDVQGRGSGADLAASLEGGCLQYRIPNGSPDCRAEFSALPNPPALSLCYCGYKTPTGEVLTKVAAARSGNEARFDALFDRMGQMSTEAISATNRQDWNDLARTMTAYQEMMRDLGVSDTKIEEIVKSAQGAMAAKISGSGLGDCVVALGPTPTGFTPVQISRKGLKVHVE